MQLNLIKRVSLEKEVTSNFTNKVCVEILVDGRTTLTYMVDRDRFNKSIELIKTQKDYDLNSYYEYFKSLMHSDRSTNELNFTLGFHLLVSLLLTKIKEGSDDNLNEHYVMMFENSSIDKLTVYTLDIESWLLSTNNELRDTFDQRIVAPKFSGISINLN